MTRAADIIDFIADLHGLDRLMRADITDKRPGAFDMLTAQAIEPAGDFPEGDMLSIERIDGRHVLIHTHKLVDALILRSAQAYSVTEPDGGDALERYEHLKDHFIRKTGFEF